MTEFLRKNDLVFDVGASVGDKTAVYVAAGCRVVAFEPEPVSFAKLKDRFADNPNVTVVNEGLADRPGYLTLRICRKARTISTFAPHWQTGRFARYRWEDEVKVPVTTLDVAIADYGFPRFIKIDVEGYELQVLRGLSSPVSYLSVEFAGEFPVSMAMKVLRMTELGYREFNLCFGKKAAWAAEWTGPTPIIESVISQGSSAWGDIYARMENAS